MAERKKEDTRGDFRRLAEERDHLRRENKRLLRDVNDRLSDLEHRQDEIEATADTGGGYQSMSLAELDEIGLRPDNPVLPVGVVNFRGELYRGPGDPSGITFNDWRSATADERAGMIRRLRP